MKTFSIYVLFPLIGWGINEFAPFIYPYGWVLIFSDILLVCFGERLKQFLTGIPWKNLRVQNFAIFLKQIC
ncbi:Chloroplast ORF70 [Oryza sativa Japonica Group]|uniref:Chloroplast ORF70 n=1 Tax=Oryza sativa subsp. japonica TaxID=39947 RepID=Q5N989_ORYSJ|nr:Chloroplast ORF70 [Oryza sativa Japonica Group]